MNPVSLLILILCCEFPLSAEEWTASSQVAENAREASYDRANRLHGGMGIHYNDPARHHGGMGIHYGIPLRHHGGMGMHHEGGAFDPKTFPQQMFFLPESRRVRNSFPMEEWQETPEAAASEPD